MAAVDGPVGLTRAEQPSAIVTVLRHRLIDGTHKDVLDAAGHVTEAQCLVSSEVLGDEAAGTRRVRFFNGDPRKGNHSESRNLGYQSKGSKKDNRENRDSPVSLCKDVPRTIDGKEAR